MRVRQNTASNDWSFGRGTSDYIKDDQAIAQNLKTRIQSFQNDWFLDINAEIDWINLLGRKENKEQIKREIQRVALATDGVVEITQIELTVKNRSASIQLNVITIFNTDISISLGIEP